MTAKAKRKKNTKFSTHEHTITTFLPTGERTETTNCIGSRDAFHRQTKLEKNGLLVVVHNLTTDTEEYRSEGL